MRLTWLRKKRIPSLDRLASKSRSQGRPDFLCIGAQKAGTSWLYCQLDSHPEFWMPPVKELQYFDQMCCCRHPDRSRWGKIAFRDQRDKAFLAAMEALCSTPFIERERYGQLFAPKEELLSGDITPRYSTLPEEIIALTMSFFPHLKIVFIARDPVERAWSAINLGVKDGGLSPFDVSDRNVAGKRLLHPDIIVHSFPSMTVARWRRHVPEEQMRVYFFDDLQSRPAALRAEIIQFLGGDPSKAKVKPTAKVNEDKSKLPLSAELQTHIAQFFARELRTCARYLGGRAAEWPARYGL
ncbi:MAG TPA: sulfotransferase [Chthoniobacterales bacterium]|nr:sulfotransferase [Chthoniobacterales bacterium]